MNKSQDTILPSVGRRGQYRVVAVKPAESKHTHSTEKLKGLKLSNSRKRMTLTDRANNKSMMSYNTVRVQDHDNQSGGHAESGAHTVPTTKRGGKGREKRSPGLEKGEYKLTPGDAGYGSDVYLQSAESEERNRLNIYQNRPYPNPAKSSKKKRKSPGKSMNMIYEPQRSRRTNLQSEMSRFKIQINITKEGITSDAGANLTPRTIAAI
jgi:hypothetical protein